LFVLFLDANRACISVSGIVLKIVDELGIESLMVREIEE